jgi:hypothetical protein
MKLRSSSSGCEIRPARGEPTRAGSEPCADRGDALGEAQARERVGRGRVASKTMSFRVPRGSNFLKATAGFPQLGEGRSAPGGVLDHGTQEEDGPGTWEALVFLDTSRSHGESGEHFSGACT